MYVAITMYVRERVRWKQKCHSKILEKIYGKMCWAWPLTVYAQLLNAGDTERITDKNLGQISDFLTPCKNYGKVGELSKSIFEVYGRNPLYTVGVGPRASWKRKQFFLSWPVLMGAGAK